METVDGYSGPPVPEAKWPKYVRDVAAAFSAYGDALCDAFGAEKVNLTWVDEAVPTYFALSVDGVVYARLEGLKVLPPKLADFVAVVEVCHREQFASADLAAAKAAVEVG